MLADLLVTLEHLRIVLQLIPDPLDQLLEERIGHRCHELLLPRVDLTIAHPKVVKNDPLDAAKVNLVQIVNEEEIIGLRV